MLSIRDYIKNELQSLYPQQEITAITRLILQTRFNLNLVDSLTYKLSNLSNEQINDLDKILNKLKEYEPIQYILGECEFYNLKFTVNRNVLIPRPETEELIYWIVNSEPDHNISILDIGTGSGCIAISLANSMPKASVYGWDISTEAIYVAQNNANANKTKVTFEIKDILKTDSASQSFDVIVSNPPYITEAEKEKMQDNVLKYEPATALFVPNHEPLLFYEKIASFAKNNLNPGGRLYFEINQYFAHETKQMLLNYGYHNVELKLDLFGNYRMIKAQKS